MDHGPWIMVGDDDDDRRLRCWTGLLSLRQPTVSNDSYDRLKKEKMP